LNSELTNWFLVFTRVSALLAALPMFGMRTFPVQLRIALGVLIALLVAPLVPPVSTDVSSVWLLARVMFVEASIGLLLGYVCRFVFFALEVAGVFLATDMGLSLPQEFSQITGGNAMAPGVVLYWLALMLLLSLDLHHWMIIGFERSYALVPAGGAHLSEALLSNVVMRSGQIFVIALQIAAPVMAVSFLITTVFALLGRAVPQMNVFTERFPATTLAGLLTFGLTCTFMAQHIANYLRRLPEDMLSVARLAGG
jgi:flagellar biosynthetic protein FliR